MVISEAIKTSSALVQWFPNQGSNKHTLFHVGQFHVGQMEAGDVCRAK